MWCAEQASEDLKNGTFFTKWYYLEELNLRMCSMIWWHYFVAWLNVQYAYQYSTVILQDMYQRQ